MIAHRIQIAWPEALPLNPPPGRRLRIRALVATAIATVLVAVLPGPAVANAAAPVSFAPTQVRDLLVATGMRMYDDHFGYEKHLVMSAEVVGWRAAHPSATLAQVQGHLESVGNAIDAGFTAADRQRGDLDRLGRLLEIVAGTPDVAFASPPLVELLAGVSGRDPLPWVYDISERLNGGRQALYTGPGLGRAQIAVWAKIAQAADIDPTLGQAWHNTVTQPAHLGDPAGPKQPPQVPLALDLAYLAALKKVDALLDVDALVDAGTQGQDAFTAELQKQLDVVQDKLTDENSKISQIIDGLLDQVGLPGGPNQGPTAAQIKAADAAEAERQETIDGIKGALDFLGGLLEEVDEGLAKQFVSMVDTAYQIATNANKLVTGLMTLASSTGIGASTFGVIGGIVGAAVGLLQLLAGLFSGDDEAAKQLAQGEHAIMEMIRAGFAQVQHSLEVIYQYMGDRFDRIDQALNVIYKAMILQFKAVMDMLHKTNDNINALSTAVGDLVHTVENVYLQLHAALKTATSADFYAKADKYVDYEWRNGLPIPDYQGAGDNYIEAADSFEHTATYLAGQAPFVANPNVNDSDAVLTGVGTAGAVSYLSMLARTQFDPAFPTGQTAVGNAELIEHAARAYTILAQQNPLLAKQEPTVRVTHIMDAGTAVLAEAAKFNAPDTPTAGDPRYTNDLFTELVARQKKRTVTVAGELAKNSHDPTVMYFNRQYDLFGGPTQSVNAADLEGIPTKAPRCGGTDRKVDQPSFVDGMQLSPPLQLGRYADVTLSGDETWVYSACWKNATALNIHDTIGETNCHNVKKPNGDWEPVCDYTTHRLGTLRATFDELVTPPGSAPIVGRSTISDAPIQFCSWEAWSATSPGPVPASCPNADTRMTSAATPAFKAVSAVVDPHGGEAAAKAFLVRQQLIYYKLVLTELKNGTNPALRALNTQTRLLRAYTALGFPRAQGGDDQLRALLYGTHAVLADLPGENLLQTAVGTAMVNLAHGKPVLTDQWLEASLQIGGTGEPVACATVTSTAVGREMVSLPGDPLLRCLVVNASERGRRLADRYEIHSKLIATKQVDEHLPDLQQALRYLDLSSRQVHALP